MKAAIEAGKETLSAAKKLGIRGIPISASDLAADGLEATAAKLAQNGLEAAQIGAFGFNPNHPDRAVLSAQSAILAKAIEAAPGLGAPAVVISCGNHHPSGYGAYDPRNRTMQALAAYAEQLKPFLAGAEKHGAIVSIEAYLKGVVHSAESFLELKQLCGNPSALKCNLDVTSLYDFKDLIDPLPLWQRTCSLLAGHVGLVHIKEIGLAEGFHIHSGLVPIGTGPTDWTAAMGLIRKAAPDTPWLMVEHLQSMEEAESSMAIIRKAAEQAGLSLA